MKLEGQGFEVFVKDGDSVKKGDKLLECDLQYIREHAPSDVCLAVFTSLKEGEEITVTASSVQALDEAGSIAKENHFFSSLHINGQNPIII